MNAKEVELAVVNYFGTRKYLIVPNVRWGLPGLFYEADLVVVSRLGYAKEIEIKVSKADLKRDKKKMSNHDYNKFRELYFAIPASLLKSQELIPEEAGILVCEEVNEGKIFCKVRLERKAKKKKTEQLTIRELYQLARLGTMRIWNLKRKILEMQKQKEQTNNKQTKEQ